jgi:hypothetical protein
MTSADRLYGVAEFLAEFGIGRTKFYEEVASGRLKAFKSGRNTFVRSDDASAWATSVSQLQPVVTTGSAWAPTRQLRFIAPESTTAEGPKLQQLWREKYSGLVQWRPIERVVVSNQEYFE